MNTAVVYARFSPRRHAAECESIETQLERCRQYCAAHGYTILSEHADREMSGGRADNRVGLQAAIADVCEHKAALVVYSLSRLARNTRDAIAISEQLDKCGADLASLHERIDTTSAMGRFVFTLMAAIAELERAQIGERTSDAMKRHQAAGRLMSKHPPFGYAAKAGRLVKCSDEQKTIGRIRGLSGEGYSLAAICRLLDDEGVKCRGNEWHRMTVKRVLDRE